MGVFKASFDRLVAIFGAPRAEGIVKAAVEKLFGHFGRDLARTKLARSLVEWAKKNVALLGLRTDGSPLTGTAEILAAGLLKAPDKIIRFIANTVGIDAVVVGHILNEALDEMLEQLVEHLKGTETEPEVATKIDEIIAKSSKMKKLRAMLPEGRETFYEACVKIMNVGEVNGATLVRSFLENWNVLDGEVRGDGVDTRRLQLHGDLHHGMNERVWTHQGVLDVLQRSGVKSITFDLERIASFLQGETAKVKEAQEAKVRATEASKIANVAKARASDAAKVVKEAEEAEFDAAKAKSPFEYGTFYEACKEIEDDSEKALVWFFSRGQSFVDLSSHLHGEMTQSIWTPESVLHVFRNFFHADIDVDLTRLRSLMVLVPGAESSSADKLVAFAQGAFTGTDPLGVTDQVRTRIATMAKSLNDETALSRERALVIDARMHLPCVPSGRRKWTEIVRIMVAVIVIFAFAFLVFKYCI